MSVLWQFSEHPDLRCVFFSAEPSLTTLQRVCSYSTSAGSSYPSACSTPCSAPGSILICCSFLRHYFCSLLRCMLLPLFFNLFLPFPFFLFLLGFVQYFGFLDGLRRWRPGLQLRVSKCMYRYGPDAHVRWPPISFFSSYISAHRLTNITLLTLIATLWL